MALPLDKRLHIAACCLATVVGLLAGYALHKLGGATGPIELWMLLGAVYGAALGTLAALVKEDYDRQHPATHSAEGWDAYATAFGAVMALTGCALVLGAQML